MKKTIVSLILTIVMVMSLAGCSVSSNGNGGVVISPSFEIGNSDYNKNEFTIKLDGDDWSRVGIGTGSTVKVKINGNSATTTFDLRLDLSKTTKDAVVDNLSSFMKNFLGASEDAMVTELTSWSNNSRLKFTLNFRF